VMATVHPSSILRTDEADRDDAWRAFVDDLKALAKHLPPSARSA
jgi:uracil-DNA glycosylase